MKTGDSEPLHSWLVIQDLSIAGKDFFDKVNRLLAKGVSVYLFTPAAAESLPRTSRLLNVFEHPLLKTLDKAVSVYDGAVSLSEVHLLQRLSEICPSFNIDQFMIEHASANTHIQVQAGAGTGKTTVMIQRIMFLLHTTSTPLDEYVMITFTKEAAKNMMRRLREKLYVMFQETQDARYLKYMEGLSAMRISTIHSFAKSLLEDLGASMGFGNDISIRSFSQERKRIIEDYLNEYISSSSKLAGMRLYDFVKELTNFWEEMEKKGLSSNDIAEIDWGKPHGNANELHDVLVGLFAQCEAKFQDLKRRMNAVSLNDLTRQLIMACSDARAFQQASRSVQYLFVDEFQDTDDTQIRLVDALQRTFGAQLFVVGDIKQSIYRFRGADYTAFDRLRETLEQHNDKLQLFSLKKNYRSSSGLLQGMDQIFQELGNRDLLVYRDGDRLTGGHGAAYSLQISQPRTASDVEGEAIALIQKAQRELGAPGESPSNQPEIAALVRTNGEARKLKAWCDRAQIPALMDVGGTFFACDAVKDFSVLVDSLVYPQSAVFRLNVMNTPYSRTNVRWPQLSQFNGNEGRILEFLSDFPPHPLWNEFQRNLRIKPVLSVLRQIIDMANPASAYYHMRMASLTSSSVPNAEYLNDVRVQAYQYQLNLDHLLELLHQHFSGDFLSLYGIKKWLDIQRATNRDEDEPELVGVDQRNRIRIMTVHKAKGLEFRTVILPFTGRLFLGDWENSELLISKVDNQIKAGWRVAGERRSQNSYYEELKFVESLEIEREEARLLYVAMTRSKRNLWIIKARNRKNTWASFLPGSEVVRP